MPIRRRNCKNYVTSVNVMALAAANRDDKYKPVIGNAAEFLKKLQWDEGEGKTPKDDFYGGAGYDSKSRPDLSNTQFFLDALASGRRADRRPGVQEGALSSSAAARTSRASTTTARGPARSTTAASSTPRPAAATPKPTTARRQPLAGYGSMTYAGIKSMIYCGVRQGRSANVEGAGVDRKNYTLDANPGMPPQLAQRGLYYYYHTMAKCL